MTSYLSTQNWCNTIRTSYVSDETTFERPQHCVTASDRSCFLFRYQNTVSYNITSAMKMNTSIFTPKDNNKNNATQRERCQSISSYQYQFMSKQNVGNRPEISKFPLEEYTFIMSKYKKVPRNNSLPVKGFLSLIINRTGTLKCKSKLGERIHFVKYVSISLKIVGFYFVGF